VLDDIGSPSESVLNPLFAFIFALVAAIKPDVRQARQLNCHVSREQQPDAVPAHDISAFNELSRIQTKCRRSLCLPARSFSNHQKLKSTLINEALEFGKPLGLVTFLIVFAAFSAYEAAAFIRLLHNQWKENESDCTKKPE
jgi:hypothetical protein